MKTVVVLAMHGSLPNDFPKEDLREFFALHGHQRHGEAVSANRYAELEDKLRRWPRTAENDLYHAASCELACAVSAESGYEVKVGFNEFCAPDIDEALAQAVNNGADQIIVASTMITRGGEHAEQEISRAVSLGKQRYPDTEIIYAWPFETVDIARFLVGHINKFTT